MRTVITFLFVLNLSFSFAQTHSDKWGLLLDSLGQHLYDEHGNYLAIAFKPINNKMKADADQWLSNTFKEVGEHPGIVIQGSKWVARKNGVTGEWTKEKTGVGKKYIKSIETFPNH